MAKQNKNALSFLYPVFAKLPLGVLYALAQPLYWIGYYGFEFRRDVVYSNLKNSFPDKSEQEIRQLAKLSFKRLVFVMVEAIKTGTLSEAEIRERVRFTNAEVVARFAEQQQSVILLAAHHCNWEWLLSACSLVLPFPIDAVYKPLHDSTVDDMMKRSRSRFGARPIPNKNALIEIMQRRKEVRGFAMVADQSPLRKEEKYWTKFMNQDSSFAVGAQKIAQLTKYPVFFVHMKRLSQGHYEVTFEQIGEPPYEKGGYEITERYARALESMILESPEDWMWSNRKWKRKKPVYE